MISPNDVHAAALAKEDENYRFRGFLKAHADGETLDRQFRELHKELFAAYDCSGCRNCCRAYDVPLTDAEIAAIAELKGTTPDSVCERYLVKGEHGYEFKKPCPFLHDDGSCEVGACKPAECSDYPYTDRPDRLGSLLSIIASAEVCPVVYELLERLKDIYHFKRR